MLLILIMDSRFFAFFLRFIYLRGREREREDMHTLAGERAEGQRKKQTPHWAGSETLGSIPGPWDHDLSREIKSRTPNQLSHPGARMDSSYVLSTNEDLFFKPL